MNAMKLPKQKSSEAGYSIVSVLMGASLLSIITAGMTQVISTSIQQVTLMEDRIELLDLKNEIQSLLANEISCRNTLRNTPVTKGMSEVRAMMDVDNNTVFEEQKHIYPSSRIIVDEIRMVDKNVNSAPGGSGEVNVIVNVSRKTMTGYQKMKPIDMAVFVEKSATSDLVADCAATGRAPVSVAKVCRVGSVLVKEGDTHTALIEMPHKIVSNDCHNKGQVILRTRYFATTQRCQNQTLIDVSPKTWSHNDDKVIKPGKNEC